MLLCNIKRGWWACIYHPRLFLHSVIESESMVRILTDRCLTSSNLIPSVHKLPLTPSSLRRRDPIFDRQGILVAPQGFFIRDLDSPTSDGQRLIVDDILNACRCGSRYSGRYSGSGSGSLTVGSMNHTIQESSSDFCPTSCQSPALTIHSMT